MAKVTARHLKYDPSDEGLVRRLGCALVMHWDALSAEQQKLFLDQAVMTVDRDETVQLEQQLQIFIQKRKLRD
ncbi:hypothetical protein [Bradyrhizobium sp. CCBAU 21362]|uniref:hypothetical protein n=1 Tax=Bradyrhizobium sp. CCBAU 21362 TaxID=1325082 RepID=UPI002305D411|nr:hypothetical protein [Bradyrhizobium sp. CCBAU 21362]